MLIEIQFLVKLLKKQIYTVKKRILQNIHLFFFFTGFDIWCPKQPVIVRNFTGDFSYVFEILSKTVKLLKHK